jgi:Sulfatase/Type I phosphodiesterase / nucleotide pyrophosphatase
MRYGRSLLVLVVMLAALVAVSAAAHARSAMPDRHGPPSPHRVLIVVMDQMRPEYVDQFDMDNVRRLQRQGVNYRRAYLGHMASETVISHNVMVSGLYPKHMGWSDEVYRDAGNVLGGGADQIYITGDLTQAQFNLLVSHANYPKLADYLHARFPGTKFATVGEKSYAVESIAAPSNATDIAVRMSSRRSDVSPTTGCANLGGRWREPAGVNVPSYLTQPKCGRFFINSDTTNDYGTLTTPPAWMYPEDGNRFVPGFDPDHLGGDTWAADAAIAIMQNENWSGMVVTLGAIDKIAHMWGGGLVDNAVYPPGSPQEMIHQRFITKNADDQLGRMLDKLRALGQLDDTLVVVTADHGQTFGEHFHGTNAPDAGNTNWYYGNSLNDGPFNSPSTALAPLIATGNVAFSYQSTAIETWLTDRSPAKKQEAALAMRTLPGVIATYIREGSRYALDSTRTSTPMTRSVRRWWQQHGQELIDTMAADHSADVVGLLADRTSYGVYGDHGGAQEEVQRIPMVFWANGIEPDRPRSRFRSVDIMPTVLRTMGIPLTQPVDGRAYRLELDH